MFTFTCMYSYYENSPVYEYEFHGLIFDKEFWEYQFGSFITEGISILSVNLGLSLCCDRHRTV